MNSSRNFLLYGQSEPPAEQVPLRAGPLSMIFEAGDLRYIRLGEREVIRRIYPAVRHRNWGAVPGRISNLNSQIAENSFRITYDREHDSTVLGVQILVALDDKIVRALPLFGLGTASHGNRLSAIELSRLAALKPAHLRVDVRPSAPASSVQLTQACADAKYLGAAIELVIHLDNLRESPAWLRGLRSQLETTGCKPARILVFGSKRDKSTPAGALALARTELGSFDVPIGAGTNADFCQLNSERPAAAADFICWSMNPQVHAFDNASIAETPEGAAQQLASVRQYFPGKPLVVSPITLKPRFNAVATGPEPGVPPGELPPQVDPRQMSLFGAAWTLAMLNALAEGGAHSVTFFETSGWRGMMETQVGSPAPDKFPSTAGQVFPVYHVFAALAGFIGGNVLACAASKPTELAVLAVRKGDRARLCLGNLTGRALAVSLPTAASACRTLRRLNEHTAPTALAEPEAFWSEAGGLRHPTTVRELTLAPCELVFLDFAPSA